LILILQVFINQYIICNCPNKIDNGLQPLRI
jgi:hypothetical protein